MGWLETLKLALQSFMAISDNIKAIADFFRKAQQEQWFEKLNETMRSLEQGPTTKEQKDAAAKAISDSIKSI